MPNTALKRKVYEGKVSSKGQIVIPKPLREAYNLNEGNTVKFIAYEEGILLKSTLEKPWTGLRGLMKREWRNADLDSLIEKAKKSLFKIEEA